MASAYFDCFSGIAGDMILGALLDLGVNAQFFKSEIQKLGLTGYTITVTKQQQNHIACTDVDIVVTEPQPHRSLNDINHIIDQSTLEENVKKTSKDIFLRLGQAERKVHDLSLIHI